MKKVIITFEISQITQKVKNIRLLKKDRETCKIIGISKPTLYTRIKKQNWKKGEIELIKNFDIKYGLRKMYDKYYCSGCKKNTLTLWENERCAIADSFCSNCDK